MTGSNPFDELPGSSEQSTGKPAPAMLAVVLRWLGVLPVALLASGLLGGVAGGLLYFVFTLGGTLDLRNGGFAPLVLALLYHLPGGFAFSFAGGVTAPRFQTATALSLTACWALYSLLNHVWGQSHPGMTNYLHASGQILGALIGVVGVGLVARLSRNWRKADAAT